MRGTLGNAYVYRNTNVINSELKNSLPEERSTEMDVLSLVSSEYAALMISTQAQLFI